jgi:hypothetical protein
MKKLNLLALAVISTGALAQATNTSVTTTKMSTLETIRKNTSMSYFADYSGSAIDDVSNIKMKDNDGNETTDNTNIWNQAALNYRMNNGKTAYVQHIFTYTSGAAEDAYQELMPRVGVKGFTLNTGAVSSTLNIGTEVGSTAAAQAEGNVANPSVTLSNGYTIDSRNSVALDTQIRYRIYDNTEANDANRDYRLYFEPSYTYAFSDKLQFIAVYELGFDQTPGENQDVMRKNEGINELLLGVNYNISKTMSIYPFVDLSGEENFEAKTAELGMFFSATVF